MNSIACGDCGDVVRSFFWQNPRACRCGAMTVHRGLARYRPMPPVFVGPVEPLRVTHASPVAEMLRACVDNDGAHRVADPTIPPSGQANEFSWTPEVAA